MSQIDDIEESTVELVERKLKGYEQDYKNLVVNRLTQLIARMHAKGIDITAEQAYDMTYNQKGNNDV